MIWQDMSYNQLESDFLDKLEIDSEENVSDIEDNIFKVKE